MKLVLISILQLPFRYHNKAQDQIKALKNYIVLDKTLAAIRALLQLLSSCTSLWSQIFLERQQTLAEFPFKCTKKYFRLSYKS